MDPLDALSTTNITTDTSDAIRHRFMLEKAKKDASEKPKNILNAASDSIGLSSTSSTQQKRPRATTKKSPDNPTPTTTNPTTSVPRIRNKQFEKAQPEYEEENIRIEEALSCQDQMETAKSVWVAVNHGIESVHTFVPFLNNFILDGLGPASRESWNEASGHLQELAIKYDLFRVGPEIRLVAATLRGFQQVHLYNLRARQANDPYAFQPPPTDEETKKSQNLDSNPSIRSRLNSMNTFI
ncbi:hypothetical protein SAMD00019534_125720 [Acytostelium subglobosum LB1]|uniref:hypothetical protein n=1 Tax=Acytostelium subglobosum LB1 TaxID=1410327 RepID=UPI000644B29A|nr:hypothetical protein SAMD00019534_125720 [Acytostelium subglobosum LB1]GAM29396.1 hypothetical protein SAMD00019534_125720 [Acytostelium subglobosum LB1]|eukprot:XP_012747664.1 hypothetical protein SAMD00019534_125720 [Acytostelium subglobosum LB1]